MTHTHTFSISLAESLLESSCRHAAWTEHPGQFATSKCSYKSLGYGTCRTGFSTYFYHAVPVKISRKTTISAGIGARSSGRVLPVQERHVKVLSHIHSGPNFPDHDSYFVLRKTSHGHPVWEVFVSWPEYLIARIITLFGTVLTFYKNSQHFFSLTVAKSRPLTGQGHNR